MVRNNGKVWVKMNAKKTEMTVFSESGEKQANIRDTHGDELKQVKRFKYLGSVIDNIGSCEKNVQRRVSASRRKWTEVKLVLNNRILMRLTALVIKEKTKKSYLQQR